MPPVTAVILGAGNRGRVYGTYAIQHPREFSVVAIADPDPLKRQRAASEHDLPPEACYNTWEDLIAAGKQADVLINCTMDQMHLDSTIAAMDAGYDVLLEKPMAHTLSDCVRLVQAAEDRGRLLQICHVLRYSPFWQALRQVVQSGRLGRIISLDHRENLVYWHMAHSFVRGNWRNLATSAPMILAKCCHDLDILHWILRDPVVWLSSFGSLTYFRPENAPAGAPPRCTDGCPAAETCKYEATRLYAHDGDSFTLNAVSVIPKAEARLEALKTGWYGRCVYQCDNDAVDHQSIAMETASGTTINFLMQGQGDEEGRTMRWDGTKATLYGRFVQGREMIEIRDHLSGTIEQIPIIHRDSSGHGGGDFGVIQSFLNALTGEPDESVTTARESLESHLLAFAAEEARLTHKTIHMPEYRARAEAEARAASPLNTQTQV